MVGRMNKVTRMQLLFYLGCELFLIYNFLMIFFYARKINKLLICIFSLVGICLMIYLIYRLVALPYLTHFKRISSVDINIIEANIDKVQSKIIIADRGADVYKIVAYYYDNNKIYIFKDIFYYNDKLFAKRVKKIIENERLPKIKVEIEKNKNNYKVKSCEYFIDLKMQYPQYFI